ncbi:DUF1176 domain-containing protein [Oricola sp.]|uniref:DUF1176 domain-containing protein n=1 Tax=Oricola sp. TaxID=1979950 RepID=UPI003BAD5CE3
MRLRYTPILTIVALLAAPIASVADGWEPVDLLAVAKAAYPGELCWWERVEEDLDRIAAHTLTYRLEYDRAEDPERTAKLYEVPCFFGAYNFGSVWFMDKEYDGLVPLHFAEPVVDVRYGDEDHAILEEMAVIGFGSSPTVVNGLFDPETREITGFSKWRGLGDAASSGTWTFRNGDFVLTAYSVDPTFDGEINPIVVYPATSE